MHENLVRALYNYAICFEVDEIGNKTFVDEITTFVMGKTIMVNQESLATILGIPNEGDSNEKQSFPNTIRTFKNQACYLSFEDRILRIFITHVLRPFGTKNSTIQDIDYGYTC